MKKKIQKQEAMLWLDYVKYREMCGESHPLTKRRITRWCAVKELMEVLNIETDYDLREYNTIETLNNP